MIGSLLPSGKAWVDFLPSSFGLAWSSRGYCEHLGSEPTEESSVSLLALTTSKLLKNTRHQPYVWNMDILFVFQVNKESWTLIQFLRVTCQVMRLFRKEIKWLLEETYSIILQKLCWCSCSALYSKHLNMLPECAHYLLLACHIGNIACMNAPWELWLTDKFVAFFWKSLTWNSSLYVSDIRVNLDEAMPAHLWIS